MIPTKKMFIEGITYRSFTHNLPVAPKVLSFSSPTFLQDVRKKNLPLSSHETDLVIEAFQEMQRETSFHTLHYVTIQIDDRDAICFVNEDMKQAQTCCVSLRSHTSLPAKKSFLARVREMETMIGCMLISVGVMAGTILFLRK